jgi:hypothetical protein
MPPELIEFAFERHKEEFERQRDRTDAIRDRVTYVGGFLTVLGGILVYLVTEFPHAFTWQKLFFYVPLAVAGFFFGKAAYFVGRAASDGSKYAAFPSEPKELKDFYDQVVAWGVQNQQPGTVLVQRMKEIYLARYRFYASHNMKHNVRRSDQLLTATKAVVVAFIPCLLSLPSFGYEKLHQEKEPTQVRLIESK